LPHLRQRLLRQSWVQQRELASRTAADRIHQRLDRGADEQVAVCARVDSVQDVVDIFKDRDDNNAQVSA
jgi:hypothetical protein